MCERRRLLRARGEVIFSREWSLAWKNGAHVYAVCRKRMAEIGRRERKRKDREELRDCAIADASTTQNSATKESNRVTCV